MHQRIKGTKDRQISHDYPQCSKVSASHGSEGRGAILHPGNLKNIYSSSNDGRYFRTVNMGNWVSMFFQDFSGISGHCT